MLAENDIAVVSAADAPVEDWQNALAVATTDWIAANENGQAIYDAFLKAIEEAK